MAVIDVVVLDGGPGSGNWGHKGRPGVRGGSGKGTGITLAPAEGNISKASYDRACALMKKDPKVVRAKAISQADAITSDVTDIAKKTSMETYGLKNRIKGEDSHMRKVVGRAVKGKQYTGADEVRFTLTSPHNKMAEEVPQALAEFESRGYKVVGFDNRYASSSKGYRDIQVTLRHPSGVEFEMQFNTPSMVKKKDLEHKRYEAQRNSAIEVGSRRWQVYEDAMNLSYNKVRSPRGASRIKWDISK
jgi:hypothetical protein